MANLFKRLFGKTKASQDTVYDTTPGEALAKARTESNNCQRAQELIRVIHRLPKSEQKQVRREALEAAQECSKDSERSISSGPDDISWGTLWRWYQVLGWSKIVSGLPEELWGEALSTVREIRDASEREWIVGVVKEAIDRVRRQAEKS